MLRATLATALTLTALAFVPAPAAALGEGDVAIEILTPGLISQCTTWGDDLVSYCYYYEENKFCVSGALAEACTKDVPFLDEDDLMEFFFCWERQLPIPSVPPSVCTP